MQKKVTWAKSNNHRRPPESNIARRCGMQSTYRKLEGPTPVEWNLTFFSEYACAVYRKTESLTAVRTGLKNTILTPQVTCYIHLRIHHMLRILCLFSQLLRLRRLWSDDSDFSKKSEAMCQFFVKRRYPVSVVQVGHHRAQQIDRQSALQTIQKENTDRTPFTLAFHPHNHAVKSILIENFKLLQNDSETGTIFSWSPPISFKSDKNIGNILVRSSLQTNDQPEVFKCTRARCKTCPASSTLSTVPSQVPRMALHCVLGNKFSVN